MATINRLKPGQVLYEVSRERAGNTLRSRTAIRQVVIDEVNVEEGWVIARWNVINPPRKYYADTVKKWRVNDPRKRDE